MFAIPLPFVVALLLVVLLVRMAWHGNAENRGAMIYLALCAAMLTVVGLRWSLDLPMVRFLQPVSASLLPPAAWLCFSGLALETPRPLRRQWPHAVPVVVIIGLSASWQAWQSPIDLVLAAMFYGYGFALLRRAWGGPDALGGARLGSADKAVRAVALAGATLIASGSVDLAVAVDFGLSQGEHAASIVAFANLLTLGLAAYAVTVAGRSRPATQREADAAVETQDAPRAEERRPEPGDADVLGIIDGLMRERRLFRDPDLTLNRLARRAGVPSRRISAAINRIHGRNVSQVVNEYRIAEARRLLAETEEPVTTILFDCGFQTKSNFNREFRRVTGMSPSDYRRSGGGRDGFAAEVSFPAEPPPETR
ncbi:AraC family transcriptional regulator [Breoghania sp. L-A4]|uniref:helix-turn-helix domain-containing protein n=1 Tax=Breoghania sp. L-A4 TaxID=2304600 RepID=UPI000E35B342|nr:AraC family transcriptional regulator [Breoghania sp. L-A4]AXS42743.1 AraC family transcriptional regulator [Breoghania sp. L-A4]